MTGEGHRGHRRLGLENNGGSIGWLFSAVATERSRRPSQIAAGTSLTKHGEPAVELLHLRVHPIGCFEISFGIGDKRSIGRMIDSCTAAIIFIIFWIMAVNVLHEFGFRTGRPCDEDSTGVCNQLNDCLKESMILRGVFAADGVRLMIDMSGWIVWVENQSVDFRRTVSGRRRQLRATGLSLVFPLSSGSSPINDKPAPTFHRSRCSLGCRTSALRKLRSFCWNLTPKCQTSR